MSDLVDPTLPTEDTAQDEAPSQEIAPTEAPESNSNPAEAPEIPPAVSEAPAPQAAPTPMPVAPPAPQTAAEIAQQMNSHDLDFQNDLAKGHVQPKTYHELFADKSTLGKIGTLFGLLVSGMGSGLTGQPNAVMEMMNQHLKRDFEAQKMSNENAQNWYRLSQAHALQQVQIPKLQAETEAQKAETGLRKAEQGMIPTKQKLLEKQISGETADQLLKADAHALNRMKLSAVQNLNNEVEKLPPGPQKDAASANLNIVKNTVDADIIQTNAQTASQIEARKKLRGEGPKPLPPAVDTNKFNLLVKQGQMNESMGLPGGMRGGEAAEATKEAATVADNRAIAKIYDDSFKKLDQAALAGKLNPQLRASYINTLGAEVARATAGRFNANEAAAQADGMFPSATDWGKARPEKYRKAMEHFQANEAATPTLDRFGLKTPFPFSGEMPTKKKNDEGIVMKGGVPYKRVEVAKGKYEWHKVKKGTAEK